jgi:hypothetical protein
MQRNAKQVERQQKLDSQSYSVRNKHEVKHADRRNQAKKEERTGCAVIEADMQENKARLRGQRDRHRPASRHTRESRKLANECPAREHAALISASIRAVLFKIYISLTTYIRSKLRTFRSDLSIINDTLLGQLYTSHVYLGFYPTDFHENLYLSHHAHSLQKCTPFLHWQTIKGTFLEELCALFVLSRLLFQRFC